MIRGTLAVAAVVAASLSPALAGQGGDLLRDHLYRGTLGDGIAALAPLAEAGDAEAQFGSGMLQFLQGIEGLTQAFYRHGLAAPDAGALGPVLGLPIPVNPSPDPLDYEVFRSVLSTLTDELDAARETLLRAAETGDYLVPVDLTRIRFDINGDGRSDEAEAVGAIMQALSGQAGMPPPEPPLAPERPRDPGAPQQTPAAPDIAAAALELTVAFDRADAFWLAGYSNVFAIQGDLLLAHDFSEFFNVAFHRLFPRAGLMMQEYSRGGTLALDPESDAAIADLIAAIHTLNWPVVESDRLARVRQRALDVTAYSRSNWQAILSETDDNAELVPSPTQTAVMGGKVTAEQVEAWLATLDQVDRILNGELLVPHWRFSRGFDLRAFFETSTRTDLVMLITGAGALPYLRDGPIADAETFAAANRAFGGDLIGYAFWFN